MSSLPWFWSISQFVFVSIEGAGVEQNDRKGYNGTNGFAYFPQMIDPIMATGGYNMYTHSVLYRIQLSRLLRLAWKNLLKGL